MKITLDIDVSNTKALALLNYIRTLDFISISEDKLILTDEQKQDIDVGLQDIKNKQTTSHEDVINQTKKRYPKLFE